MVFNDKLKEVTDLIEEASVLRVQSKAKITQAKKKSLEYFGLAIGDTITKELLELAVTKIKATAGIKEVSI